MATKSFVGKAYVLPNPNEHQPTIDEYFGAHSPAGPIARHRSALTATMMPRSSEAFTVPAMYLGNFPVMSDDKNSVLWGSACFS
jgi:hypothetical protein